MSTLWMEIVPGPELTQVRVQKGPHRTLLRARLPHSPSDPRAVAMLCCVFRGKLSTHSDRR